MNLALTLDCGDKLGEGTSGSVYALAGPSDGRRYCVKVVCRKPATDVADALAECRLHASLPPCDVIVQYYFSWSSPTHAYILLERMSCELWDAALAPAPSDCNGLANLAERLQWSRDVATALQCLHAMGVAHRDVNPWNLFLSEGGSGTPRRCKLGDLGLAARLPASGRFVGWHEPGAPPLDESAIGSLYSAPELGAERLIGGYNLACDIFSAGQCLVAIWHKAVVHTSSDEAVTEAIEAVRKHGELSWIVPSRLASLVRRLTAQKPEHRPSAREALAELTAMHSAQHALAAVAESVPASAALQLKGHRPRAHGWLPAWAGGSQGVHLQQRSVRI